MSGPTADGGRSGRALDAGHAGKDARARGGLGDLGIRTADTSSMASAGQRMARKRDTEAARNYVQPTWFGTSATRLRPIVTAEGDIVAEPKDLLPGQYDTYTPSDEREALYTQILREKLSDGAGDWQAQITEDMVDSRKKKADALKAADFDAWLHTKYDIDQPGMLEWVEKVAPGFVERRLALMERDQAITYRKNYIKQFGIQDQADLEFQYAVDRGLIETSQDYKDKHQAEAAREMAERLLGDRPHTDVDVDAALPYAAEEYARSGYQFGAFSLVRPGVDALTRMQGAGPFAPHGMGARMRARELAGIPDLGRASQSYGHDPAGPSGPVLGDRGDFTQPAAIREGTGGFTGHATQVAYRRAGTSPGIARCTSRHNRLLCVCD